MVTAPGPRPNLRSRARRAVVRRVDAAAARRTATLARRKSVADTDVARALAVIRGPVPTAAAPAPLSLAEQLQAIGPRTAAETVDQLCSAFERLYLPTGQPAPEPAPRVTRAITDSFHRLYYNVSPRTWKDTWYRGVQLYKCPPDMWVYQELVDQLRPGLVIETGTFRGGSALFLADRLEIAGHGEVVTIDVDVQPDRPSHPRLTYLTGSSVAPEIVAEVRRRLPTDSSPVLVVLDSDHSRDHVAAELEVYAPLVTVGSYLIVEDTNVNGHPTAPNHGPGPWEATHAFLAGGDTGFEVDRRCERYFVTQNPDGFLRRVR